MQQGGEKQNVICFEEFKKLKEKTEIEYKKVKKIYSPALKSEIVFNSDGFHHLRYDGSRSERNKSVQKNKFIFFLNAVDILKKSTTVQEYRRLLCPIGKKDRNGFRKTSIIEWFGFFSIISFSKMIRIKTVIRRIGGENGQYHFWSVMPFWNLSNKNKIVGTKEIEDN